jgi:cytochrome b561
MFLNSTHTYGLIAILLHWLMALLITGLFVMGIWMVDLDYYHAWYHRAPDLHKSLGVLTLFLFLFRVVWRWANPLPEPEKTLKNWERKVSHIVHITLYILTFIIILSGYLISTAGNNPVSFFGWFDMAQLFEPFDGQEDQSGEVHRVLSWVMIILVGLHTLASLKHHFIDHDKTLLKMLGRRS